MNDFRHESAEVSVDGQVIDPMLVAPRPDLEGVDPSRQIELSLGIDILSYEFKSYGVLPADEDLRKFVADDLSENPTRAMGGYIEIVQRYKAPKPGLFPRFRRKKKVKWLWISVDSVGEDATQNRIVIRGSCISV